MAQIECRQARLDDAGDILALLLTLAPEIPLAVETLEREEALYALIRNCARSGESWVATDPEGRIVAFVLVEPNQLARHYAENETLELHYAGVAADRRRQGVFATLIGKVLARLLPVTTTIPPQNQSAFPACLARLGFRPTGEERRLRWESGKP
jgi:GNAT superfamily N-acetyltransferase